jgi:hypothetical protein
VKNIRNTEEIKRIISLFKFEFFFALFDFETTWGVISVPPNSLATATAPAASFSGFLDYSYMY